jgi:hypothetical protein
MKILNGSLVFENGFSIVLHQTIRLPEDGQKHSLPPSMGRFPMKRIEDYKDRVPAAWRDHGGVFIPMHEREAMWLGFGGETSAVKVATGKVNAVSGAPWKQELSPAEAVGGKDPQQDYMVAPSPQPWLDGFNTGEGEIRQFVAMKMGQGYTVEAQVTGKEDVGGIQILVVPPKPGKIPPRPVYRGMAMAACASMGGEESLCIPSFESDYGGGLESAVSYNASSDMLGGATRGMTKSAAPKFNKASEMGLAQGGRMDQQINVDPYGIDTWDQANAERIFIHIVNADLWEQITGEKCPPSPVSAQEYKGSYYKLNENPKNAVQGSGTLANVKPVSQKDKDLGFEGQQDDSPVKETKVVQLCGTTVPKNVVKDGNW